MMTQQRIASLLLVFLTITTTTLFSTTTSTTATTVTAAATTTTAASAAQKNKKKSNNKKAVSRKTDRSLQLINESGGSVNIYWVNPSTGDTTLMSEKPVTNGADFPMNSYVGHEFQVRQAADQDGNCGGGDTGDTGGDGDTDTDTDTNAADKTCQHVYLTVSENDNQVGRITKEMEIVFVDNKIEAQKQAGDLVADCQAASKKRLLELAAAADDDDDDDGAAAEQVLEDLVTCVQGGVATALERVNEEIAFQAAVRMDIAGLLENYTCADENMESSKDIETRDWYHAPVNASPDASETLTVHVKHDRPASKIHLMSQFIRPDECQAMADSAKRTLHHATVADGEGGSRLSDNRKAMQAGIRVPWNEEKDDNPIARISRRVYDYTNYVLGLDINEHGQEDLMSIQYFGRGKNDTAPDRYMPHCDGDCTGMQFKQGNRMATVVMYCDVPESGGHTNFRNVGVHIKPSAGDAIFFSYIDPETLTMDTGFTEHSGCPVYDGEKKIVTQWIRLGVDDENPWDSFNTLGVKLADVKKMENGGGGDDGADTA